MPTPGGYSARDQFCEAHITVSVPSGKATETLPFISVIILSFGRRGSRISRILSGRLSVVLPKSMSDHLRTNTVLSPLNLSLCPAFIS